MPDGGGGGSRGGTRFHLVRHAEHTLQGKVLVGRMEGVVLSAAGRAQVAALAETFAAGPGVHAVASSPVARARETAEGIAARLGLPVQVEPGLNEVDFGPAWTGQPFAALDGQAEWRAWNRFRGTAACPGGEAMAAVQGRILGAMRALRAAARPDDGDGEIVLVSHADVLKAALAGLLGAPLDLMHRFALDPGCRAVVTLWDEDARVEALNLPPDAGR